VRIRRSFRAKGLKEAVFLILLVGLIGPQAIAGGAEGPGVPEVRLGHGSMGSFRWGVYASRENPSASPQRPCVTAVSGGGRGSDSGGAFTLCGSVRYAPVLVARSSGEGKRERTILGMGFSPNVTSVRLWLPGRKSRQIELWRLDPRQSAAAGLMRFRYATRVFAGPFCLRRFAAYDASGDLLDVSPPMGCPALGKP